MSLFTYLQGEAGDCQEGGGGEPTQGSVPVGNEAGRPPGGAARTTEETTPQEVDPSPQSNHQTEGALRRLSM